MKKESEIIKALEHEIHIANDIGGVHSMMIPIEPIKCALDLINRQQAEIERLNIRNKALTDITKNYDWKFAKIKAEAIKEFAERLSLDIQRHLMPNVGDDGTVTVENAERYFLSRIKKLTEGCEK